MMLTPEQQYYDGLWRQVREATRKMRRASQQWDKINDEVNDWMDRMADRHPAGRDNPEKNPYLDSVGRADIRVTSMALQDAYATWQFWAQSVVALTAALQAEETAQRLLGVGDPKYAGR